ncbi:hypothetical protein DPMN_139694 [Dreissena polymorpha]|uniref:Uncharacterized protein n=1 Tax=Dreissena polymorpha TaxID=45954 RepID=A0A9D4G676_DREPO|nr:hypothetical protein DPMN_139694 [Dreissena polymorpha]
MFFKQLKSFSNYIIRTIFRVLTRKNAPPPDGHVFQPTGTIFERIQDIETNLITKFYGDCTISDYVASREKFPAPWQRPTGTIFILVQDIICTYLLTKFH